MMTISRTAIAANNTQIHTSSTEAVVVEVSVKRTEQHWTESPVVQQCCRWGRVRGDTSHGAG